MAKPKPAKKGFESFTDGSGHSVRDRFPLLMKTLKVFFATGVGVGALIL